MQKYRGNLKQKVVFIFVPYVECSGNEDLGLAGQFNAGDDVGQGRVLEIGRASCRERVSF